MHGNEDEMYGGQSGRTVVDGVGHDESWFWTRADFATEGAPSHCSATSSSSQTRDQINLNLGYVDTRSCGML
jgi:hypothetical protein